MKNAKKVLLLVLCAALLVSASIAGTVAYLTSKATVTNTVSVGKVVITLNETDTDKDDNQGDNVTIGGVVRDTANAYHLLPGHTYTKDPIVYVEANSENSWVFVKVENGLKKYVGDIGITTQITTTNGWSVLQEEDDNGVAVYYKEYTKQDTQKDLPVFATFTIPANNVQGQNWTAVAQQEIIVTAYAIQKSNGTADGFSASAAWTALNNQLNPPANS